MDSENFDVFVSYRWVEPDKSWVRRELVPRLRAAGLRVCLDVDDFIPGRDLVLEMQRAGLDSSRVLAVLTPDYFDGNRMVHFESLSARRRDPSGQTSSLVPLLLRECTPPDWIRGLIPVDFTSESGIAAEWTKLLRALGASDLEIVPPPGASATANEATSASVAPLDLVDIFPLVPKKGTGFGWDFLVANQSARQYQVDRLKIHGEVEVAIAGARAEHDRYEYEVSLMTKATADEARLELHGSIYDDPKAEWGRNCSGTFVFEFSTVKGHKLWQYELTLPISAAFPPAKTTTVRLAFRPDAKVLKKKEQRGSTPALSSFGVVSNKHGVSFLHRGSTVLEAEADTAFLDFISSLK